jgi:hypothetical protein
LEGVISRAGVSLIIRTVERGGLHFTKASSFQIGVSRPAHCLKG